MLRTFLKNFNLIKLKSDYYIFINYNTDIIITVYMNNLLLIESMTEFLQNLKNKLAN